MRNKMAFHGSKPTVEDLVTMKLLQNYPELANEYTTQEEVSVGHEIGRIDILSKQKTGGYIVVEVKSNAARIDEAIGQVLRYNYLLCKQRGCSSTDIQNWIAAPKCYPSHAQICKQLGIKLVVV